MRKVSRSAISSILQNFMLTDLPAEFSNFSSIKPKASIIFFFEGMENLLKFFELDNESFIPFRENRMPR